MIPKTIHYCWLSKDPLPPEVRECISSWKKHMPDWKIKHWGIDDFNVRSVPFVYEAVAAKKWAFAADYIRLYALYTEGGVYFDSDVLVRKNIDFVINNRAFSAIEFFPQLAEKAKKDGLVNAHGEKLVPHAKIHGIQIQAAILGSEKGHPFFKDCIDYYNKQHFSVGENGVPKEDQICPIVLAGIAEQYGFKYLDIEQNLREGIRLYPSSLFCSQPYLIKPSAVAVHCCNASWRQSQTPLQHLISIIKDTAKNALRSLGLRREEAIDAIK